MTDDAKIELLYDKQCPACDLYCRLVDVRESEGRLVRVDAEILDVDHARGAGPRIHA